MVDLMADLGFDTFSLAGHDRGGRVSYRLTLDHPERVERLSLLDIIPTAEQFEQMGIAGGLGGFHWYFLAQPAPLPETLINGAPDFFLKRMLGSPGPASTTKLSSPRPRWPSTSPQPMTRKRFAAGARTIAPARASTSPSTAPIVPRARRLLVPLFVIWGAGRQPSRRGRFMATWHRWATNVTGVGLPCGHFLPEELPDETEAALKDFFAD